MTQPNPEDAAKAAAEAKAKADAKAKAGEAAPLELLELVVFEHHDPIFGLGHSRQAIGVVVGVDDQGVTVRPLAHHDVRVAHADVQRYDDAGDVEPVT